jgi:hypothetical protein
MRCFKFGLVVIDAKPLLCRPLTAIEKQTEGAGAGAEWQTKAVWLVGGGVGGWVVASLHDWCKLLDKG